MCGLDWKCHFPVQCPMRSCTVWASSHRESSSSPWGRYRSSQGAGEVGHTPSLQTRVMKYQFSERLVLPSGWLAEAQFKFTLTDRILMILVKYSYHGLCCFKHIRICFFNYLSLWEERQSKHGCYSYCSLPCSSHPNPICAFIHTCTICTKHTHTHTHKQWKQKQTHALMWAYNHAQLHMQEQRNM